MHSVIVVTTFPNAALAAQIGEQALQARIAVSREAARADLDAGYTLVALCEPDMKPHFQDLAGPLFCIDDPGSKSTTMGWGRRKIIQVARDMLSASIQKEQNDAQTILWREPEKNLARFVPDIIRPIEERRADIVIPRRKSLASYPAFSQDWEATGSLIASMLIGGEPQDYWVGPRAFNLRAAEYFLVYPGTQQGLPDWHDCIFNPILDAVRDGLSVSGVDIDFQYPPEQREAEENDMATMKKRMAVMHKLARAMYARSQWHEHVATA